MKTINVTSTRIIATTPQEKYVVKSWGGLWQTFGQRDRAGKGILLLFGDWSGYRSSQYRITHVDWCYHKGLPEDFRGIVRFTDGTTMTVWTRRVTRSEILERLYERKRPYTELINKLIKSGETFYDVAAEKKEAAND